MPVFPEEGIGSGGGGGGREYVDSLPPIATANRNFIYILTTDWTQWSPQGTETVPATPATPASLTAKDFEHSDVRDPSNSYQIYRGVVNNTDPNTLVQGNYWYDRGTGIWQFAQSGGSPVTPSNLTNLFSSGLEISDGDDDVDLWTNGGFLNNQQEANYADVAAFLDYLGPPRRLNLRNLVDYFDDGWKFFYYDEALDKVRTVIGYNEAAEAMPEHEIPAWQSLGGGGRAYVDDLPMIEDANSDLIYIRTADWTQWTPRGVRTVVATAATAASLVAKDFEHSDLRDVQSPLSTNAAGITQLPLRYRGITVGPAPSVQFTNGDYWYQPTGSSPFKMGQGFNSAVPNLGNVRFLFSDLDEIQAGIDVDLWLSADLLNDNAQGNHANVAAILILIQNNNLDTANGRKLYYYDNALAGIRTITTFTPGVPSVPAHGVPAWQQLTDGFSLGPEENEFVSDATRDTYATANAAWLAQYNADRTFWIQVGGVTGDIQRRNSAGDDWEVVTGLIRGPAGGIGPVGPPGGLSAAQLAELARLSGVETGATQDQSGAEIKSAYESQSNTNAYTNAEKTKLGGVAAFANQLIPYKIGNIYRAFADGAFVIKPGNTEGIVTESGITDPPVGWQLTRPEATVALPYVYDCHVYGYTTNGVFSWQFGTPNRTDRYIVPGGGGSPDTAAQILAKLLTVDGTGSGLDADLLDGMTPAQVAALGGGTPGTPGVGAYTPLIVDGSVNGTPTEYDLEEPLAARYMLEVHVKISSNLVGLGLTLTDRILAEDPNTTTPTAANNPSSIVVRNSNSTSLTSNSGIIGIVYVWRGSDDNKLWISNSRSDAAVLNVHQSSLGGPIGPTGGTGPQGLISEDQVNALIQAALALVDSDFDLHDDVLTELTGSLSASDRWLVSNENVAGAPNQYVTTATLQAALLSINYLTVSLGLATQDRVRELIQAALVAAVTGNTETNITVVHNADGTTDFAVIYPNQVTQAEAEAGTSNVARLWTPQRVEQAIAALAPGGQTTGLNQTQVDARIQAGLMAAVTGNTETGIAVSWNPDGTLDFVVSGGTPTPTPTHTRYGSLKTTNDFGPTDFTGANGVNSDTSTLAFPAYTEDSFQAFALRSDIPDPTDIREEGSAFNAFDFYTKQTDQIEIGGEMYNIWRSNTTSPGFAATNWVIS